MFRVIPRPLPGWVLFGVLALAPCSLAQEGPPPLGTTLDTERQSLAAGVERLKTGSADLGAAGNELFGTSEIPLIRVVDPVLKALHDRSSGASSSLTADSRDLRVRLAELSGRRAKILKRCASSAATTEALFGRLPRLFERWDKLAQRVGEGPSRRRAEAKEEFLTLMGQISGILRGVQDFPEWVNRNVGQQRELWTDLMERFDGLSQAGPSLGGEAPARLQAMAAGWGKWLADQNQRAATLESAAERILQETAGALESLEIAKKRLQQYRP